MSLVAAPVRGRRRDEDNPMTSVPPPIGLVAAAVLLVLLAAVGPGLFDDASGDSIGSTSIRGGGEGHGRALFGYTIGSHSDPRTVLAKEPPVARRDPVGGVGVVRSSASSPAVPPGPGRPLDHPASAVDPRDDGPPAAIAERQAVLAGAAHAAILRGDTAFRVHAAGGEGGAGTPGAGDAASADAPVVVPRRFVIAVANARPGCQYSVTIASHGRYTGTAAATPGEGGRHRTYLWDPPFPGAFEVLVHEIDERVAGGTPLVAPSPFPIWAEDGRPPGAQPGAPFPVEERARTAPPCQTRTDPDLYARWDGDWIGPDLWMGADRLRTGWSFVPGPRMNCRIESFSRDELRGVPAKRKIYVLGSSIQRGVFLSLVDVLMDNYEKKELRDSVIGKCWGRATVTKGNLEVMYQDFRSKHFEDPSEPPYIVCHNDKLAKDANSTLIANATAVWREIFQQEEAEWPSVIFLIAGDFGRFWIADDDPNGIMAHWPPGAIKWENQVRWFVENLPPAWRGTLFLNDNSFSARKAGLANTRHYDSYLQEIASLTRKLNDPRVRWIDGHGISKEMRMHGERGEGHVTRSQHFHGWCEDRHGMNVCSNVTEMVAQLLLGHALGPKQELLQQSTERTFKPAKWCHTCPKCLVPAKIIPYPKMMCGWGQLKAQMENEKCSSVPKEDTPACPQACLGTPVKEMFGTESDKVHVRHCPPPL